MNNNSSDFTYGNNYSSTDGFGNGYPGSYADNSGDGAGTSVGYGNEDKTGNTFCSEYSNIIKYNEKLIHYMDGELIIFDDVPSRDTKEINKKDCPSEGHQSYVINNDLTLEVCCIENGKVTDRISRWIKHFLEH